MDGLQDAWRTAFRKVKLKLYDQINPHYIRLKQSLSPLELGVLAALSTICIFQVSVLVLQWTRFVLVTYNLLRVLATVFCLFSFYTWLSVICGKYWTDSGIYALFFTCFLSEFLLQFIEFNANAKNNQNAIGDLVNKLSSTFVASDYSTAGIEAEATSAHLFTASTEQLPGMSSSISGGSGIFSYDETSSSMQDESSGHSQLLSVDNRIEEVWNENSKHVFLVAILCILTNLLTNMQPFENLFLISLICLTRLYGAIFFAYMLPVSICAYFSYFCAFAGVVFSEYIKVKLSLRFSGNVQREGSSESSSQNSKTPVKNPNGLLAHLSGTGAAGNATNSTSSQNGQKPRHSNSSQHKNSVSTSSSSSNRSANMNPSYHSSISNGTLVNNFSSNKHSANPRRKLNNQTGVGAGGNLNAFSNLPHLQYKRRTSLPIISHQKAENGANENQQLREVQNLVNELLHGDDMLSLCQNKTLKRIRKLVFQLAASNNLFSSVHLNSGNTITTNPNKAISSNILPPLAALQNGLTKANIYRNYPPFSFISSTNSEATSNEINYDLSDNCDMNSADEDDESRLLPTFTNYPGSPLASPLLPSGSLSESKLKSRLRRSLPGPVAKRPLWSTTTSATGLPNIESIPSRQRTLSLKIPTNTLTGMHTSGSHSAERSPLNSKCGSLIECSQAGVDSLDKARNTPGLIPNSAQLSKYEFEDEEKLGNLPANVNKTSDYDSGESPNNSDYNSDTDKLLLKDFNSHQMSKKLEEILEESTSSNNLSKLSDQSSANTSSSDAGIYTTGNNNETCSQNGHVLPWNPDELGDNVYLNHLNDWSFPIFQFYDTNNEHVLSQIAYKIFDNVGLFASFSIPIDAFVHYFSELESGYQDLPYHNRVHAADVLHACYYLTTQRIPGLLKADALGNIQSLKERAALNSNQYSLNSLKCTLDSNYYGCVGNNMTPLELLALYCSAAMHDYEHPGRNNQFLVTISSPLALLYNDKSVLENHHAAASWKLLVSDPKFNFLADLDRDEWKRFRFLCLENILATDLNRHFTIISEFKTRFPLTSQQTMGGLNALNWKNEQDRLLVSQVILKLADINAPLKDRELHIKWTERIVEEFYLQGEEEMRRDLPVSPFMDRKRPQVAQLQQNFITNLVGTLFTAYIESGLLPGILIEDLEIVSNEDDGDESSETESDPNTEYYKKSRPIRIKPKVLYSELQSNYISNYKMWLEKSKQEQSS